jgi:hypothetical protein
MAALPVSSVTIGRFLPGAQTLAQC